MKVKPHMTKKRGVNSRSDMSPEVYVVGVISDTHGLLRPEVAAAFAGVQLILHAGDVGGADGARRRWRRSRRSRRSTATSTIRTIRRWRASGW